MKIVCFGDSNTWGYDPRSYFGGRFSEPWPALLGKILGCPCINCGDNGREIPHSDAAFASAKAELTQETPFTDLIIMLGSNGISHYPHSSDVTAERMENFLRRVMEWFANVRVLLTVPPVMRISEEKICRESAMLASRYRALAERLHVDLIDTEACHPELCFDGMHLSAEGHHAVAHLLTQYFQVSIPDEFK